MRIIELTFRILAHLKKEIKLLSLGQEDSILSGKMISFVNTWLDPNPLVKGSQCNKIVAYM